MAERTFYVRRWVAPRSAAALIRQAKQLGIDLVDRERQGDVVMLRFSVPAGVNFSVNGPAD